MNKKVYLKSPTYPLLSRARSYNSHTILGSMKLHTAGAAPTSHRLWVEVEPYDVMADPSLSSILNTNSYP